MHNRQAITWSMFWESMCDFDLWPLYLVRRTTSVLLSRSFSWVSTFFALLDRPRLPATPKPRANLPNTRLPPTGILNRKHQPPLHPELRARHNHPHGRSDALRMGKRALVRLLVAERLGAPVPYCDLLSPTACVLELFRCHDCAARVAVCPFPCGVLGVYERWECADKNGWLVYSAYLVHIQIRARCTTLIGLVDHSTI